MDPGPALLDIYAAMVVGERSKVRDFSDQVALDRLTHHVHILEMNGDSYRLKGSRQDAGPQSPDCPEDV